MKGPHLLDTHRFRSITMGLGLVGGLLATSTALANTGPHQYEFEHTGLTNDAISGSGSTIDSIFASFNEADNQFV